VRRVDRRRLERRLRVASILGLTFALGALTDIVLTWRLDRRADIPDVPPATVAEGTPAAPAPPHDPTGPPPVPRLEAPEPAGPRLEAPDPEVAATTGPPGREAAIEELRERGLRLPVDGIVPGDLRDTYADSRNGRSHEAIDIMAPRHTPVRAVEDGRIARLFSSAAGGLTIYLIEESETFCYYYAHLERYDAGLREGDRVARGQIIGYVGTTGNAPANAPHLHFAIFRLTSERQWWKGEPLNPYPVLR
jgi:murein DD-endopeptidase MepM/ murein hydrolase activator NlpD